MISNEAIRYFIAIGDNPIRRRIEKRLNFSVSDYVTIIHPKAVVDELSTIKEGSLIMANAVIQTNSVIGYSSIINTSAVVERDTEIGNFVYVALNATITGNYSLAAYVFLEANDFQTLLIQLEKLDQQAIRTRTRLGLKKRDVPVYFLDDYK